MPTEPAPMGIHEECLRRAGAFLRAHRHNADTSEAIWATDDLAEEFERVAREARAKALKDAADWCQDVGRADSNHQRANAAFHCVSIIQIRSRDTP